MSNSNNNNNTSMMSTDEFGRVIPGRGGSGSGSGNHHHSQFTPYQQQQQYNHQQHHHHSSSLSVSSGPTSITGSNVVVPVVPPLLLDQPLSSSRYNNTATTTASTGSNVGGVIPSPRNESNLLYSTNKSSSRYNNNNSHPPHHHHGHHQQYNYNQQHQSRQTNHHQSNYHNYQNHPSLRYISEPLLCQFLYQEQMNNISKKVSNSNTSDNNDNDTKVEGKEEDNNNSKNTIKDDDTKPDKNNDANNITSDTNTDMNDNNEYKLYVNKYCLNYIRCFFNIHLDDIWFKYIYSLYHIYKYILNHYYSNHSILIECYLLKNLLYYIKSLCNNNNNHQNDILINTIFTKYIRLWERKIDTTTTNDTNNSNSNGNNDDNNGVPLSSTTTSSSSPVVILETPIGHLFSFQQAVTEKQLNNNNNHNNNSTTTDDDNIVIPSYNNSTNSIPNLLALHIIDIPPYMTDAHIMITLQRLQNMTLVTTSTSTSSTTNETNHTTTTTTVASSDESKYTLQIWPSQQQQTFKRNNKYGNNSNNNHRCYYTRDIVVTGIKEDIQNILHNLISLQNKDTTTLSSTLSTVTTPISPDRTDVPRKQHQLPGSSGNNNNITNISNNNYYYRMEVECNDLYGRTMYDVDGRGTLVEIDTHNNNATSSNIKRNSITSTSTDVDKKENLTTSNSNDRIVEVLVSLLPLHNSSNLYNITNTQQQQPQNSSNPHFIRKGWMNHNNNKSVTVTLSAALSSRYRIESDRDAAYKIAMALDKLYNIPSGLTIQDMLNEVKDDNIWKYNMSDQLDFIIAYLRRVHLFTYYNGCTKINHSVCDVVTGKNATSTIHVRMNHADEFLMEIEQQQKKINDSIVSSSSNNNNDETNNNSNDNDTMTTPSKPDPVVSTTKSKDLLVQRLDDAIAKALHEYCGIEPNNDSNNDDNNEDNNDSIERTSKLTIQEERQEQLIREVTAIKEAENLVQQKWLSDHANMDNPDQRARCSFNTCNKLFKDSSFLYKHLLKKHSEYLHAEQAKCHDEAMMKAWDNAIVRPVPDILVNCGELFGTVACPVIGTIPTCIDPEPELWKNELERRQREAEMKARRNELRNNQYQQQSKTPMGQQQQQSGPSPPPSSRSNNFVDVDDMKVEKVELSFDNVIVPNIVGTVDIKAVITKKKKRKLL